MDAYLEQKESGSPHFPEVDRENLWHHAFGFCKTACDYSKPIRIKFGGGVEQGIDAGGPHREYFQIIANKLASIEVGYFEGLETDLLPVMNMTCLQLGHLKTAGKMIAHSIANGGVGFPFLAEAIYHYFVTSNPEDCLHLCRIDMVPQTKVRDMINEIARTENKEAFDILFEKSQYGEYALRKCGWNSVISFEKKTWWQQCSYMKS